jgi:protein-S-isoprenylcysteine O-methyltransferase Ste14
MIGIALGAASFFVVFWVDAVSLKGMSHVKPVLWLASTALFITGVVFSVRDPARVDLPSAIGVLGWVLSGAFLLLLIYSLFIEIPFISAYVKQGQPAGVVSRGTYALCRHPGVLWLAGLIAALFLGTGSLVLLVAMPVWVGLDALYVVLQEKLFFMRMFGADYGAYQRAVPMLVPTTHSMRECARTLFRSDRK